jgi:hypothetical protein
MKINFTIFYHVGDNQYGLLIDKDTERVFILIR